MPCGRRRRQPRRMRNRAQVSGTLTALPSELADQFAVADAIALGVNRGRLRRADLERPFFGVRVRQPCETLAQQLRALSLVLPPSAVFSHETASQMLGLPFKRAATAIHVTLPPGECRIRRPGIVCHRAPVEATLVVKDVVVADGVSTWTALAGGYDVDDLVVLGDAIATREPADLERLRSASGRTGLRGVRRMREALPLVRTGVKSPMESRARLVMARAGLPEALRNHDVHHPVTGEWLGQADFVWLRQRVVAEYDGEHHRTDRAQWQADIVRKRQFEDAGWRVVVFTADDVLRFSHRLVESLRVALGC